MLNDTVLRGLLKFNFRIIQMCLKYTTNLHYITVLHWPKYLLHPAWHLFLPRQGAESDRGCQPRPSPASSPPVPGWGRREPGQPRGWRGWDRGGVVWWCIQYILDLFEWNFNQSLNLAGCLPQSSPPPASLPSHTPITNTTHSNSVLYRTVSTLEKKLKNSLTFFVLFYILSINLKQTV